MYTLLVGKCPYEGKNVKSTYKRIIANVYTFPDHVSISERAKDLIRSVLQSKPKMRPTFDQVHNHEFFTANDVKIPLSLPQSSTLLSSPGGGSTAIIEYLCIRQRTEDSYYELDDIVARGREIIAERDEEVSALRAMVAERDEEVAVLEFL
ncbi:hypothetical protein TL16_g02977 [Triparma laevis f. inornata]|uniref:Protein kinase domain-containing protein n=1 Tax=Triparma laevis f. inornata TaxID=1714386 RepID=A0A9W7A2D8_9STRA|nr:hypothetical protein TL16_g02977 [Triparma laevis f. inornata]